MDSNIDIIKFMTQGTCAKMINVAIKDGKIMEVEFIGGCNGNLKGIAALVKGKDMDEVIALLKGIDCNFKGTSCPDQLARALEKIKSEM